MRLQQRRGGFGSPFLRFNNHHLLHSTSSGSHHVKGNDLAVGDVGDALQGAGVDAPAFHRRRAVRGGSTVIVRTDFGWVDALSVNFLFTPLSSCGLG